MRRKSYTEAVRASLCPAPCHNLAGSGNLLDPGTYERRGLLPAAPRSPSGYRLFPPESLARVQLIRSVLSVRVRGRCRPSRSPKNQWPQAGAIVGSVCRHSPEVPRSEFSSGSTASRQSKTGEAIMRKIILAVAVCCVCVAGSLAQQSSTEQKADKPSSPAMCPMHDAHAQMN